MSKERLYSMLSLRGYFTTDKIAYHTKELFYLRYNKNNKDNPFEQCDSLGGVIAWEPCQIIDQLNKDRYKVWQKMTLSDKLLESLKTDIANKITVKCDAKTKNKVHVYYKESHIGQVSHVFGECPEVDIPEDELDKVFNYLESIDYRGRHFNYFNQKDYGGGMRHLDSGKKIAKMRFRNDFVDVIEILLGRGMIRDDNR